MSVTYADLMRPDCTRKVFVIEDNDQAGPPISQVLSRCEFFIENYSSAEDFLEEHKANGPTCLLLDEHLPGMSGSDLLRRLYWDGFRPPTVFVAENATTPLTVEAMQHGAVTVLDKPCTDTALRDAIGKALDSDAKRLERERSHQDSRERIAKLSDVEREVLQMVLDGVPNKQIAKRLNVCVRTVEARRSKIYQTTGVPSVAALVRLCVAAGFIEV